MWGTHKVYVTLSWCGVFQSEEYIEALEDIMIKREDGIRLMPELYAVPTDKVWKTSLKIHILVHKVNTFCANFFNRTINMYMYLQYLSFLCTDMTQVVGILPRVRQGHAYSTHHGCWWPGDTRSQGISNNDIELIKPEITRFPHAKG